MGSHAAVEHVVIDLTTEVRWFFDGDLPDEVSTWFTPGGTGLVEERCDRYRLDDAAGVGVKERSKTTLELKMRMETPELFAIGSDLDGQLETWQRWSPADHLVGRRASARWVEVKKRVVKRRFRFGGHEVPMSADNRAMTGSGCDAEVASLEIDGRPVWTFALAAFGPIDGHRRSLEETWAALCAEQPRPAGLKLECSASHGYPDWLNSLSAVQPEPAW